MVVSPVHPADRAFLLEKQAMHTLTISAQANTVGLFTAHCLGASGVVPIDLAHGKYTNEYRCSIHKRHRIEVRNMIASVCVH